MGFDTNIGKVIYTCLTKFYSALPIEEKDFDKQYKTFIRHQTKIGWRQFIRGRIAYVFNECISFTNNASNVVKNDPLKYICKILIAHHLQAWNRYASDRHESDRHRTSEINILHDLLTESKRYYFTPDTQKMFEIDLDTIKETPLQALHDRISHLKLLLNKAKSNSWILPNSIRRYFGPPSQQISTSSDNPTSNKINRVSRSGLKASRPNQQQHSSPKSSSQSQLTRPHSHRLSSKNLLRQFPKSRKKVRTTIRMYNIRQTSPRTKKEFHLKISPKKFQEKKGSDTDSYENSIERIKRRKFETMENNISIPNGKNPLTRNTVQEPEHRKKKLAMFHIP